MDEEVWINKPLSYLWFILLVTYGKTTLLHSTVCPTAASVSAVHILLLSAYRHDCKCSSVDALFPATSSSTVQLSLGLVSPPNHLFISLMTSKLIYKAVIYRKEWDLNSWLPVSVNCGRRELCFPGEWRPSGSYVPLEDDMSSSLRADAQYELVTPPVLGWVVLWCCYLKIKQYVTYAEPLYNVWYIFHCLRLLRQFHPIFFFATYFIKYRK